MIKIPAKILCSVAGVILGAGAVTVVVGSNAALNQASVSSTHESTVTSESSSAAPSSEALSSVVESSSSAVRSSSSVAPSSKAESKSNLDSETESAVSKIHTETKKSVSTIKKATSEAVKEVKKAVSEASSAPVSSEPAHKVSFDDTNKMYGNTDYKKRDGTYSTWDIECESSLSLVDEANKTVIINYCGHFDGNWEDVSELKSYGFTLKNASGQDVDFEQEDFCRMKIPYTNLSDVSTLYFTYKDQAIKISVS